MTTTILRGFKVPVVVLDAFLIANGVDETSGYPPLERGASNICTLLHTKMGSSNYHACVVIPQHEAFNNSDMAYVAYSWVKVFAQRELRLHEELPEEVPTAFNTLRQEILGFSSEINDGTPGDDSTSRIGLFVVVTGNRSWLPAELRERDRVSKFTVCIHYI